MSRKDFNKKKKTGAKALKTVIKERPAGLMLEAGEIRIVKEVKTLKKTSFDVAFISGRIGSTFVSAVVRGTEERVRAFGRDKYELHHYPSTGRKNGSGDAVREILKGEKADAIIILSVMPDDGALELIRKSRMPVVFVERAVKGAHSVTIDNYTGGYSAGLRFINSGRIKPGLILDPQSREKGTASAERLRGFREAMKKHRVKIDPQYSVYVDIHTIEQGREVYEKISARTGRIDSVFSVAGDLAAIGFMIEARANGINIPDQLAIIGFDDVEMASAVEPQLTTVRQPIHRMGAAAMEIIHEHLKGGLKNHSSIVLESELIIRGTA